ncbi:MAG: glycoside hydrolase family 30 protein [Janthinobacterium lividum]
MTNKLLPSALLAALGLGLLPPAAAQTPSYSAAGKSAQVFTTAQGTSQRLAAGPALSFKEVGQPVETQVCVFVDPTHQFQTILGIGGALTDAAAETFAKLPKAKQQELLQAYYSPTQGIGYSLARTHIASCDFSSESYVYIKDGDTSLKSFSVKHDEKYKIPLIKQATAAAGGQLTLFATPWTPPAWMKTNNDLLHGGHLKPEYAQPYANYFVKFVQTYEKMGIPIWGLSVQNEEMATQKWESCVYTADEERAFIKVLGPTLQKAGLGDKKLIAWDHNRDLVLQRASAVLDDPESAKYLWGIAYHWYETWTGSGMLFDNVRRVHELYPNTNLIFTEGCGENFKLANVGDWALGERYGYSLINDFNAGTTGWTDWNILLDETGGPNHTGNFCYAPVHADTKTGQLTYTNSYYYIGHFSKFVRPGAKRVAVTTNRDWLQATAFQNTDGKVAVVIMNRGDKPQNFQLWIKGQAATTTSPAHSMATYVIN